MSNSIVTNKFRYRIVKSLEQKFADEDESIYFFYGTPVEWFNENFPDILTPSNEQENITKSNFLALKKVSGRDLRLGAERIEWASNTIYAQYTDKESLDGKNYYVITSQNNVYKCLGNNTILNSEGYPEEGTSTIEPNHTGGLTQTTTDGYIWKHMLTVSDAINRKFNIADYIPLDVNDSITQGIINSSTPGTIDNMTIDQTDPTLPPGGRGYYIRVYDNSNTIVELPDIPIFLFGDGDEVSTAKIEIQQVTAGGGINLAAAQGSAVLFGYYDIENPSLVTTTGYRLTEGNRGSGYSNVNDDWIPVQIRQISSESEGGNVNADVAYDYAYGIAKINENQSISALRILNSGSGYNLGEAEVVQSSAIGYGTVNQSYLNTTGELRGKIKSVRMEFPGRNYSRADAVLISEKFEFEDALLSPIISPFNGHGSNPEIELRTTNILFNVRIAYEELGGDFSVGNDFRTVGIVENIEEQDKNGDNRNIGTSLTLSAKTDLVCKDIIDLNAFKTDDLIVGVNTGARARIVDVINGNTIRVIRDIETSNTTPFIPDEFIKSSSTGSAQIESINESEYVPFSGDILFINNREAIQRSNDQIETINFILKL